MAVHCELAFQKIAFVAMLKKRRTDNLKGLGNMLTARLLLATFIRADELTPETGGCDVMTISRGAIRWTRSRVEAGSCAIRYPARAVVWPVSCLATPGIIPPFEDRNIGRTCRCAEGGLFQRELALSDDGPDQRSNDICALVPS